MPAFISDDAHCFPTNLADASRARPHKRGVVSALVMFRRRNTGSRSRNAGRDAFGPQGRGPGNAGPAQLYLRGRHRGGHTQVSLRRHLQCAKPPVGNRHARRRLCDKDRGPWGPFLPAEPGKFQMDSGPRLGSLGCHGSTRRIRRACPGRSYEKKDGATRNAKGPCGHGSIVLLAGCASAPPPRPATPRPQPPAPAPPQSPNRTAVLNR